MSLTLLAAAMLAATMPVASEIQAPGPQGPLAGTLLTPGKPNAPVVLIIPGSGPTNRDGNNPMGLKGATYKLVAEGLAARGIASVRIDKRGMFGSRAAIADPNAVTIGDYAADIHAWAAAIRKQTGARCVWVLGHSEGGLVALAAGQQPEGICGLLLVSAAGRPLGTVIRAQLRANPANAPVLAQAEAALDSLEAGKHVDTTGMHQADRQCPPAGADPAGRARYPGERRGRAPARRIGSRRQARSAPGRQSCAQERAEQ